VCLFFSAAFLLAVATTTSAQTYTALANFGTQPSDFTLSGSNFYGTTTSGGNYGYGMVFQISTNGTGFTVLHSFGGGDDDGGNPNGSLTLSGSTLYGTTVNGGNSFGDGTVFQISTNVQADTNGTGYAILYSFVPKIGSSPSGSLTLSGTNLFGVTTSGNGTLFRVDTGGGGATNLHVFGGFVITSIITNTVTNIVNAVTNVVTTLSTNVFPDGTSPNGSLTLSGSTLYGTTTYGGSNGFGTVFQINTDGSGYSILHQFSADDGDGEYPHGSLILSGSTLYGTTGMTSAGGFNNGTVYQINANGTGFAVLYEFGLVAGDGYNPIGSLTLSNSTLYGTTDYGGTNACDCGTVFQINTDGSGYQILYDFFGGPLGGNPQRSVILSGSTLYGMAGSILFSLTVPAPPPPLTVTVLDIIGIAQQGDDISITWTNNIGATNALQATTNALQVTTDSTYDTNNFADIFIVTNTVSPVTTYIDAGAVTNFTSRYYRVRLVP